MADPVVFTSADLAVAQAKYAEVVSELTGDQSAQLSPMLDLVRAFRTPVTDYDSSKLRMDALLEGNQRAESVARVLARAISLRAGIGKNVAAPADTDAGVGAEATKIDDADLRALQAALQDGAASDSPFDELERRRTFYQTFVIAMLRYMVTDGRINDPDKIRAIEIVERTTPIDKCDDVLSRAREQVGRWRRLEQSIGNELPLVASALTGRNEVSLDTAVEAYNDSLASRKSAHDVRKAATASLQQEKGVLTRARGELAREQDELTRLRRAAALADAPALRERYERKLEAQESKVDEAQTAEKVALKKVADGERGVAMALESFVAGDRAWRRAATLVTHIVGRRTLEMCVEAMPKIAPPTPDPEKSRLVMLVFQPHIAPGNRPDRVVDFELEVGGPYSQMTQVLYLHPTRSYDLSDQRLLNAERNALSLAVAAQFPNAPAAVAIDADQRDRREQRAQYLSRIEKTTSFARRKGGTMKFGWSFFPSNLSTNYKGDLVGFIEAGGRDCAAYLLVPQSATSITLTMRSYERSLYRDVPLPPWPWRHQIGKATYTIPLPALSRSETEAGGAMSKSSTFTGVPLINVMSRGGMPAMSPPEAK